MIPIAILIVDEQSIITPVTTNDNVDAAANSWTGVISIDSILLSLREDGGRMRRFLATTFYLPIASIEISQSY